MDEEKSELPICSALIPNFYQNFHCLAQDCRDSCCVGWRITFDKKDYLRLRRLDGPDDLKARLEQSVRRIRKGNCGDQFYSEFDLEAGSERCPFLDKDGLCSIQRRCGQDVLPHVCTSFPRKIGYSPVAKEYTLSPACEGVLQQLWDLPDGVEFVEDLLPKSEQRTANLQRGDNLLLYFAPLRALCIDILQNRAISLTDRMIFLGVVIQRLQKEDWTNFDPDSWVAKQMAVMAEPDMLKEITAKIPGSREMYLMQNTKVLDAVAAGEKEWPSKLYAALKVERQFILHAAGTDASQPDVQHRLTFSQKSYTEALDQFEAAFSGREYFFENLMVAVALFLGFPNLTDREVLWRGYVALCSMYSFYRFVSVLGCKDEPTKEQMFHYIVRASRVILHNRDRFNGFQEELFQHDSSTLAHMAILLRG